MKKRAFTLIEVMVCLCIIGVVTVSFVTAMGRSSTRGTNGITAAMASANLSAVEEVRRVAKSVSDVDRIPKTYDVQVGDYKVSANINWQYMRIEKQYDGAEPVGSTEQYNYYDSYSQWPGVYGRFWFEYYGAYKWDVQVPDIETRTYNGLKYTKMTSSAPSGFANNYLDAAGNIMPSSKIENAVVVTPDNYSSVVYLPLRYVMFKNMETPYSDKYLSFEVLAKKTGRLSHVLVSLAGRWDGGWGIGRDSDSDGHVAETTMVSGSPLVSWYPAAGSGDVNCVRFDIPMNDIAQMMVSSERYTEGAYSVSGGYYGSSDGYWLRIYMTGDTDYENGFIVNNIQFTKKKITEAELSNLIKVDVTSRVSGEGLTDAEVAKMEEINQAQRTMTTYILLEDSAG